MPPDELDVSPDTRTNEDLDKLADSSDVARNSERPMTAPKETAGDKPKEETFEFEHGGKKVKGTREQLIKWAQMGYDRPQAMAKFNKEKADWENQRKAWENQWGVYKQIDDFAKQNADWWKYVESNWQGRGNFQPGQQPGAPAQGQAQSASPDPRFNRFEQEISEIKPVVSELKTYLQRVHETEEDTKLDREVQSIREQHKDLDWESIDENGKSLELRVLEHAQTNGIPSFKAAFRDLLHEDLLSRAGAQAKLAVSKGIQQRTKLGVLGESPTPAKGYAPQRTKGIRQTSYEELEDEIRQELRQGLSR